MYDDVDEKLAIIATQLLVKNILELNKQELLPLNMFQDGTLMSNGVEQFERLMSKCKEIEDRKTQEVGMPTDEYIIYSKAEQFFRTLDETIMNYDEKGE
jgi:hypothetical protein